MEKIKRLKKVLTKEKIDGYLIPKNDQFFEEYVDNQNDRLKYISNFSGSYGFALILKDKNYLFVDGRYTLQAASQSGKFFKIITFSKKKPYQYFNSKKVTIGFDPKLFTKKTLKTFFFNSSFKLKSIKKNLIDDIWKRNFQKNIGKFYSLPNNSVDNNYQSKIDKLTRYLKKVNADYQFISASQNIAWLLNIRGDDAKYTPLPFCHALISKKKNIICFCDLSKISTTLKKKFNKIQFLDINLTGEKLSNINKKKFIIDTNTCSFFYENIILEKNKILNFKDPIYHFKSLKSSKEIKNIERAHLQDGVALTKYLFWLKRNFATRKITEISASQKLYELRKKNRNFKCSSFPTISAAGPNGAIIHYNATRETNRILKKGDIYLVDSGGQYEYGTTDVTRTISLNNINNKIKNIFTRVLKGHIAVASYKLNNKTCGSEVDLVARKYLKQIGLDYAHGTGHGVGYFLNVHEGPQAITRNNKVTFKEGMIVSNEPGYYEKNKFGIRIENLIYVKKDKNKKFFKNLTMAPIEKELINKNLLNKNEKLWLNKYHSEVYKNLKKSMNKQELFELKKACSAI